MDKSHVQDVQESYYSSSPVQSKMCGLLLLRISPLGEVAEAGAAMAAAATDPIRSFLSSSAASGVLIGELCALAATLSSEPAVPYRSLRAIWCATSSQGRPPLRQLLRGAEFLLSSPKPREKSDELKARLGKLREAQERREYAELVRDVAPRKEDNPEPFSSYKDQIGFGLCSTTVLQWSTLVVLGLAEDQQQPAPQARSSQNKAAETSSSAADTTTEVTQESSAVS